MTLQQAHKRLSELRDQLAARHGEPLTKMELARRIAYLFTTVEAGMADPAQLEAATRASEVLDMPLTAENFARWFPEAKLPDIALC